VQIAPDSSKLAVVMVGLPARGKSYTARRIERYLSWLGYRTGVFNVGEYRRARVGAQRGTQREQMPQRNHSGACGAGRGRHCFGGEFGKSVITDEHQVQRQRLRIWRVELKKRRSLAMRAVTQGARQIRLKVAFMF